MKNIGIKILIVILVLLIVAFGALLGLKIWKDSKVTNTIADNNKEQLNKEENKNNPEIVEIKEVQTFKGEDRPIAVMIDNHKDALPHGGLNKAYLIYEIIVEGGESRLMALFKGQDIEKIGPVRSSRHYFLDYALENDAIYVHFGWSPQAQSDISKLGVNNINGIYESSTSFWRVKDKYAPHNAVTSTEKILEIAKRKGYRTTSNQKSVLNYVTDEVNLDSDIIATKVSIPYSGTYNTASYEYNEKTGKYTRYSKGIKAVEWTSGETLEFKNIIIEKCENWTLNDGENKGRQTINNVKKLNGYYITNGKAIEITCEKSARNTQTVYKDLQGNEIKVNDGNTFIQICPLNAKVSIEPGEKVQEETNQSLQTNTTVKQ